MKVIKLLLAGLCLMFFITESYSQVARVINNRVGIGTNSPSYKLHVVGDMYGNWIRTAGQRGLYSQTYGTYLQPLSIYYWATRSDRGLVIRNRAGSNRGYLYHNNSNGYGMLDRDGNWSLRMERDAWTRWSINNIIRMTLQGNGRLDIPNGADANGSANTGALQVQGSLRLDGNEIITNTNSILLLQHDNNGDLRIDNSTFFVDASANRIFTPYIGDANNSSYYLDPSSISRMNLVLPASDNTGYCGTSASTWNYGYFRSLYRQYEYQLSDKRAKENIRGINNALGKIMQLEGKLFNYKENLSEGNKFMNDTDLTPETIDQGQPVEKNDAIEAPENPTASTDTNDEEGRLAIEEIAQPSFVEADLISAPEPDQLSAQDQNEIANSAANKSGDVKDTYGFIAQDAQKIIPEAVDYDQKNDIYSMSYTSVIPLLVEAVKEQQKQIEAQEKQIAELKKLINQK